MSLGQDSNARGGWRGGMSSPLGCEGEIKSREDESGWAVARRLCVLARQEAARWRNFPTNPQDGCMQWREIVALRALPGFPPLGWSLDILLSVTSPPGLSFSFH